MNLEKNSFYRPRLRKIRFDMNWLRNLYALFRGVLRFVQIKLIAFNRCKWGRMIRIFKNVRISVAKKGSLTVGNRVKIDELAMVCSYGQGNILLSDNVAIGRNNIIVAHQEIKIGEGTIFAPNVMIYDHDHVFSSETGVERKKYKTAPVIIGKNCWIGANTIILRGTVIGDNCVIGAGAVIKGEFPAGSVIIQKRETTVKEVVSE